MMPSHFVIFQVSIIVLLMTAFTYSTQSAAMVPEISQSYDDEQNPAVVVQNHHHTDNIPSSSSKDIAFGDDDSQSDEESDNDYSQVHHYKAIWPQMLDKRYANQVDRRGNAGDSRLWAIPYRFGKRSAMPYRFGKRAGMHFRLGKKSASL